MTGRRLLSPLATACLALPAAPQLADGDLVAICGDSITEQMAYSVDLETYLLACQPARDLEAMQFGWGGEVTPAFLKRMENDVLRFEPSVVTLFYGGNDGGYRAPSERRERRFRECLREIVRRFKAAGVREVLVASPGCVDTTTYHLGRAEAKTYNVTLGRLGEVAREVAREEEVAFADVHALTAEVMARAKAQWGEAYPLAGPDGVHPGPNGHLVIAHALLLGLGCDGDIGQLRVDLATGRAEGSEGHEVLSFEDGLLRVRSTRYPFCFQGDPSSPEATTGVIRHMPFNEELNRYRLVVTGAGAERLRVTWGEASRELDAAELERGVNLAARFLDNPFAEPFARVRAAVRAQQELDKRLVKFHLHDFPTYFRLVPEEAQALERIAAALVEVCAAEREAARRTVQPVEHVIRLEVLP